MLNYSTTLSVVIPCYNDGLYISEAVNSIFSIRNCNVETIIVDDGSTDRQTILALSMLENEGYTIIRQVNSGPGRARNTGVAAAKGRIILPLDADNRVRPDGVARAIAVFDRHPDVDVVYGDVEFFEGRTGIERVPDFDLPRLLSWNYVYASSLFRKTSWERFGGFDNDRATQGYEDWDFWCRIACNGGMFHHVHEILHEYRVRGDSFGGQVAANRERTLSVLNHIRSKRVQVSMGDYLNAFNSWDAVVNAIRQQPARTLVILLAKAFFPSLWGSWISRKKLSPLHSQESV